MNLGQLAKAVAARFLLPEGQARELLAFALETMAGNLRAGRRVYFRGYAGTVASGVVGDAHSLSALVRRVA